MRSHNIIILIIFLFSFSIHAQNMEDYTDNWEGKIENSTSFNLRVEIKYFNSPKSTFLISNSKNIINYEFKIEETSSFKINFDENFYFEGSLSKNGKEINGFIKSGLLFYHLKLIKSKNNSFVGSWNILMVDELTSQNFYLSIENGLKEDYEAYPFFGDDRFTGTWCNNFTKNKDRLSFSDFKTGLKFKGRLLSNKINLEIFLGNNLLTDIELKKSENDWKIGGFKSEVKKSPLHLSNLEDLILKDSVPNTHSILISRRGKLIYENYFHGYNINIPHDMRSASKSISSAIVGIAKDKSLFKSVDQSIFEFITGKYQLQKDSLKSKIDIKSLLTMSSGLDAIDYGINANPKSPATEDNYQRTQDFTAAILSAPMIKLPNTTANYGSANPYLLGIAMNSVISEPLELFIDKNLFQKLQIANYIVQSDLNDVPYFAGGMYLLPKDMLKFGELYLQNGKWKGEQVISQEWIQNSFKNYRVLQNTVDKNGYGYLWWHGNYQISGKNFKTVEARGAGGQYIILIPVFETVVVITSGNFKNGKSQQPEMILEKYILPELLSR